MSHQAFATLATAWRYPVKSMQGEELNASTVTMAGILGDRAFALIDSETGSVVSAKNPKKWPDMFSFRAGYAEPPRVGKLPALWITLPDGTEIRSDQGDRDGQLSQALGRDVVLQGGAPSLATLEQYWPEFEGTENEVSREAVAGDAPVGSFYDYATVHLLTTSSLQALARHYPAGRFEVRRFRPNLVVNTDAQDGFVENDWVGKTIRIGETVRLLITDPCPRCVMPTLPQGDLPKDPALFKEGIAKNNIHVPFAGKALPSVGVYARVLTPGVVRRGDSIVVE